MVQAIPTYAMSIFKLPVSIFNCAMLGKQVWRLHKSQDALWSKVLKSIYFPNGDIWNAQKGRQSSWGWKSMLVGRESNPTIPLDKDLEPLRSTENPNLPVEHLSKCHSHQREPEREFIAWVLWQIWKARNARIFRDKLPNSAEVIDQRNGNHPEMES